ncbi:DUF6992 family protein [Ferruginibacter yonginensis]|uniref:DUF6992 family protein n=1 Tax=Ferruginibacter yonginensis TaxID=1310416 RepID=A0ABV8QMP7_9BACT
MKFIYTFTMFVFSCCNNLFAQQFSLQTFNAKQEKISKNGIKVLGSFAGANIIYGSIAANQTNGKTKYFHEMNAIWNSVTLGIVGLGILTSKKGELTSFNSTLTKQQQIEKLFLFNIGLDAAYIAGGAYIKERSFNSKKNALKLKGYGESIMLQGGALLLFDGVMYYLQHKHGKKLQAATEKLQFTTTSHGIGLLVRL